MDLTDARLAREVADVLDIPYSKKVGQKVVQAFTQAIVAGLSRGERVKIDGFGIFSVRTRASCRHRLCYFPFPGTEGEGPYVEMGRLPEKKYVHFAPSKALNRFIAEGWKPEEVKTDDNHKS